MPRRTALTVAASVVAVVVTATTAVALSITALQAGESVPAEFAAATGDVPEGVDPQAASAVPVDDVATQSGLPTEDENPTQVADPRSTGAAGALPTSSRTGGVVAPGEPGNPSLAPTAGSGTFVPAAGPAVSPLATETGAQPTDVVPSPSPTTAPVVPTATPTPSPSPSPLAGPGPAVPSTPPIRQTPDPWDDDEGDEWSEDHEDEEHEGDERPEDHEDEEHEYDEEGEFDEEEHEDEEHEGEDG